MRQFARMDNLPTEDATQSKDKPRQDKPQQTNKSAHTTDYSDAYGDPQSSVEIDVINPQTHGTGRHMYTSYEIRVETNNPNYILGVTSVRRRYSDFLALSVDIAKDRDNPMTTIPPLPEKRYANRFNDDVIEQRRLGLQEFLRKLSTHPFMQKKKSVKQFMQDPNWTPENI